MILRATCYAERATAEIPRVVMKRTYQVTADSLEHFARLALERMQAEFLLPSWVITIGPIGIPWSHR